MRPAVWTPSVGPERRGSRSEDRGVLRMTERTWPEGGKVSAGSGRDSGAQGAVFKNALMHPTTLCAN